VGKQGFENMMTEAEARVESYRELVNKGFFPPVIAEKEIGFEGGEFSLEKDESKACQWCEFGDLCRADNRVTRVWNDGGKQD